MAAVKTRCPITREQFREFAEPLTIQIGHLTVVAEEKEFATGSLGWYANGRITVEVGGVRVAVQVGINLTIVGSKETPQ